MILEINQLLKENNIEYSIHGVGGCTCCGLELRQDGKSYPTDNILEIINGSLKKSLDFLQFIQNLIKNLDYKVTQWHQLKDLNIQKVDAFLSFIE